MIASALEAYIQQWLVENAGIDVAGRYIPVGGGSINQTYRLEAGQQRFFCKINSGVNMFVAEKAGLTMLAEAIRTPAVLMTATVGGHHVLLMEWIEQGVKTDAFWRNFGEQLAALHHHRGAYFGLDSDNFMGSLPQSNTPAANWVDFFIHQRLQPQIELALKKRLLEPAQADAFQKLYVKLPELFAVEPPCLLHGDLWSGNYLCDDQAQPVLIDPAVYYGHRSIDLAMTTLFGGFDTLFYESYHHHYPLPPDYRQQWDVCNLYPLLIHLNLFGKSYLADILHTIRHL